MIDFYRGALRRALVVVSAIAAVLLAPRAFAVVVLDFEGIGDQASINNFYNGGTDSQGNAGTNFGVEFTSNSLGIIDQDAGGGGNFANEPSPDTVAFFLEGTADTMTVPGGFTTGFSFFYTTNMAGAFVRVFDGPAGTGNMLGQLDLSVNATSCGNSGDPNGGDFACWTPIGVSFSGVAHSVSFGGAANFVAFDNVTLGSANAVPEPSTLAFMLAVMGLLAVTTCRRGSS